MPERVYKRDRLGRFAETMAITAQLQSRTPKKKSSSDERKSDVAKKAKSPRGEARRVLAQAQAAEPAITADLQAVAATNGAEMAGLEFRLKSEESLTGKIVRDMLAAEEDGAPITSAKAANDIGDVVRYTMVSSPGSYMATYISLKATLEARGYTVAKDKNFWPKGGAYRGINLQIDSPTGQRFELQVHTAESFNLKMSSHIVYEMARDPKTPLAERERLVTEMVRQADALQVPPGAVPE